MTATSDAWQAVGAAAIVVAYLLTPVIHHQIREADHVGQRDREQEDASQGHFV